MKIARILVPTDFSQRSLVALEDAIDIARDHNSQVVLVHVIEPLPYGTSRWDDPTKLLEHSAEHGRNRLESLAKRANDLYPNCTAELHFGILDRVLSQLARNLRVDLVVLPARPQHRFFERFFSSLAEKLVRQVPCPVLALQVDGVIQKDKHPSTSVSGLLSSSITSDASLRLSC